MKKEQSNSCVELGEKCFFVENGAPEKKNKTKKDLTFPSGPLQKTASRRNFINSMRRHAQLKSVVQLVISLVLYTRYIQNSFLSRRRSREYLSPQHVFCRPQDAVSLDPWLTRPTLYWTGPIVNNISCTCVFPATKAENKGLRGIWWPLVNPSVASARFQPEWRPIRQNKWKHLCGCARGWAGALNPPRTKQRIP